MLPALGVFLRPPWLCMARSLLAREVSPHPHSNNIYDTRHATAFSLRRTHSVVDQPESTTKNPDGGPSNGSVLLKTSILVEKKLPKLLPEHSSDDAIFEDEGQEYSTVASILSPSNSPNSPNSSIHALAQLIELRDFDRAYSLLKEIQDLNISIPPSFAYEIPAQAALRHEDMHSAIIEQFTAWMSLIPSASDDTVRKFDETSHLIFQAKIINLPVILSFTKMMASKGYGQTIIHKAIPLIMRYSSFEAGLDFLDEFNEANAQYWNAHNPKIAKEKSEMLANLVHGLALRHLARSDRVDDALSLLPDPEDSQIRLSSFTYDVLLRRLERSKNVAHRQQIPMVEKLRSQKSMILENDSAYPLAILGDEAQTTSMLKSALPAELTENLANDLRYMKVAFLVKDLVPHPFTIVNFINAYLFTGRTRALELLYIRAARTSYRVLFTFLFAEMLFYHRLRQYELVIETFVDHFYLTGVPRERVLKCYNHLSAKRRAYEADNRGPPPPERCYKFDSYKAYPRGKSWPLSSHCNIVYHALLGLTPEPEVEDLYQELLLIVEHGKDKPTTPAITSLEALITNSRGRPSSGAFTPFFRRLMSVHGAARGAKILKDMVQCGLKPTTHHYTELAGFYATVGESQKAFLILDNLEERFKNAANSSVPLDSVDQGDMEDLEAPTLPGLDRVVYISLMRGFIKSKNLTAATNVADRLKQRYEYTIGENRFIDSVFKDIEYLKEEQRHQVRFFF